MTLRSPRWRAALICGLMLVAGMFTPFTAEELSLLWQQALRPGCVLDSGRTSTTAFCAAFYDTDNSREMFLVIVPVVALVLALAGLRWAVRPIRDLAEQISGLGPQNFAYRVRAPRRRGEMTELATAVNDMIARVAVGYESQRRFAADASHELRTPLAVQRTLIEVGLAENPDPDQLRVITGYLLRTNERNVSLIEALLVLSESDRGLASRSRLSLDKIAGAIATEHRPAAAEASVTIVTDLAPREVLGEQVLLERLITNLVQNAIKYNKPGGTVTVKVGTDPTVLVTNTGDEIPPEAVAALFEPFRRLDTTRIDHSGGVGLGLTIARSIAQAHNATITATPNPNGGLQVALHFPPADD